jgi:hypothetical protein
MKKYLLLFVFIFALASARVIAQNPIEIYDNANNLITGTTITAFSSDINVETIDMILKVKNNTANDLSLFVRRIVNSEVAGTENVICFGVNCYPPSTDTSSVVRVVPVGVIDSSFLSHYSPYTLPGITSITYVFFESHGSATAEVTVKYHLSPLSLGSELNAFEISAAYPNPASASTSIEYNIPSGKNGKILLRNLLGIVVREIALEKQEGKAVINTIDLKDGLYFYSVLINNKVEVTRKLVIRH